MLGSAELTALAQSVGAVLKERGETVTVAESACGGLISAALLAVPGASAYYAGGTVIYTYPSRRAFLGLTSADVEGLEPMTEAMASRFATLARQKLDADWALVELGIAGPTGSRYGIGAGNAVVGIDGPTNAARMVSTGSNDRTANMDLFARGALEFFAETLHST